MKKTLIVLFCLVALAVLAANPSFQSFLSTQFATYGSGSGQVIGVKVTPYFTNVQSVAILNTYGPIQSVGGNARGTNSIDLQTVRSVADQVAAAPYSSILSGRDNEISSTSSTSVISGGLNNAWVAGSGSSNSVANFLGGGFRNGGSGSYNVIGGGRDNEVDTAFSFIGGGDRNNILKGGYDTIAGGYQNYIQGGAVYGSIAGGNDNVIDGGTGVSILGGWDGYADRADYASIGGGLHNWIIRGTNSFIYGGYSNQVTANKSGVIGFSTTNSTSNSVEIGVGGTTKYQFSNTNFTLLGTGGGIVFNDGTRQITAASNSIIEYSNYVAGNYIANNFGVGTNITIYDGAFESSVAFGGISIAQPGLMVLEEDGNALQMLNAPGVLTNDGAGNLAWVLLSGSGGGGATNSVQSINGLSNVAVSITGTTIPTNAATDSLTVTTAGTTVFVKLFASTNNVQTPWLSDIDAAGFSLTNANRIRSTNIYNAGKMTNIGDASFWSSLYIGTNMTSATNGSGNFYDISSPNTVQHAIGFDGYLVGDDSWAGITPNGRPLYTFYDALGAGLGYSSASHILNISVGKDSSFYTNPIVAISIDTNALVTVKSNAVFNGSVTMGGTTTNGAVWAANGTTGLGHWVVGGGNQTPWTSDIDAAGFNLWGVTRVGDANFESYYEPDSGFIYENGSLSIAATERQLINQAADVAFDWQLRKVFGDWTHNGSLTVTNVLTANVGVASAATNRTSITTGGWTNTFGVNAQVNFDGINMTFKYTLGDGVTFVYTNGVATGHADVILQPNAVLNITAGSAISGRASAF